MGSRMKKTILAVLFLRSDIRLCLFLFLSLNGLQVLAQVKIHEFGDYVLENGQVLKNAKIGYETYGTLNPKKDNAVLFATWYGGNGKSLKPFIGGQESMIDTTKYHLIVVDALGDGVSSSPSNSLEQQGSSFPEFSIKDMVDLQYRLLNETLGIAHLYAVTGISMGGMQTYQWMASYPDYFDKAIPILGTPELSSYDLLAMDIFKRVLANSIENPSSSSYPVFLMLEYLLGLSPDYYFSEKSVEDYPTLVQEMIEEAEGYDPRDLYSQMKAIFKYDLGPELKKRNASSLAEVFQGQVLMVMARKDHVLSPNTSKALIAKMKVEVLELDSNCGHYSFNCEVSRIGETVSHFLERLP